MYLIILGEKQPFTSFASSNVCLNDIGPYQWTKVGAALFIVALRCLSHIRQQPWPHFAFSLRGSILLAQLDCPCTCMSVHVWPRERVSMHIYYLALLVFNFISKTCTQLQFACIYWWFHFIWYICTYICKQTYICTYL